MNKSLLNLCFKSELYKFMLNKKAKKDNKQFGIRFVKKVEENSKSGK